VGRRRRRWPADQRLPPPRAPASGPRPQQCGPPQPHGCGPPGRTGAAPKRREPGERESDPDGEDHPERPKSPAAASLGGGPLGVGRTCPPTSPPRGGWVDPSVLIAAIDEAAQSVGETAVPRTAAALYGIALRESRARPMDDPLRAMAAAYARGTAEAVDEAQVRSHRPGCAPLRDLPALAFHIARRQLTGEGPPPWPERRPQPSRSTPPATTPPCWSPSREGAGHVGPELLPAARPEREVTAAVTTSTAWDDLDAAQRARAEALVRQEQPELTRLTEAQGAIWRQAVIAAAAQTNGGSDPIEGRRPGACAGEDVVIDLDLRPRACARESAGGAVRYDGGADRPAAPTCAGVPRAPSSELIAMTRPSSRPRRAC
jgi:hypothetical protein